MTTESTDVEPVLSACTQSYAARRVGVETIEADISLYPATFDGFSRAGWDVWVLVPTEMLGSAHRYLRGVDVVLQPWWEAETGILFGRPEIP